MADQAETKPIKSGFVASAEADVDRIVAAIEKWYAAHFHRAAVNGTAPISADDKAALIQHVTNAVTKPQE